MQGIGAYAGGFPQVFSSGFEYDDDVDMDEDSVIFILYLLGFIIFTLVGSFTQLKYTTYEDSLNADVNDFMRKEHA